MEILSVFKILLLISLYNVSYADQRQKVIDFHADCLETHGVDVDTLIQALEGKTDHDEDFYKHIFCVAKKSKIINDEGVVDTSNFEIDMAGVIDASNMENVAAIIRKCVIQKDDIMTTITESAQCFLKETHNL